MKEEKYLMNEETEQYLTIRKTIQCICIASLITIVVLVFTMDIVFAGVAWSKMSFIAVGLCILVGVLVTMMDGIGIGFTKKSPQAWFDLYARRMNRKSSKKASTKILLYHIPMARACFEMHEYQRCYDLADAYLQELKRVHQKRQNKKVVKGQTYGTGITIPDDLRHPQIVAMELKALSLRYMRQEEACEEQLQALDAIYVSPSLLGRWQNQMSLFRFGGQFEIEKLLGLESVKKKFVKTCGIHIACMWYLLYFLIFVITDANLPHGYELRTWFMDGSAYLLLAGGVTAIIYLLWRICKMFYLMIRRTWAQVISILVFIAAVIVVVLFAAFVGFMTLASSQSEKMLNEDTILVTQYNFLDANTYYICHRENLFVRERLYECDMYGQELYGSDYEDSILDGYSEDESETVSDDGNDSGLVYDNNTGDAGEAPQTDENGVYSGDTVLEQQYMDIFDSEYNVNDGDEIEFRYSAKGVLYAVITNSDPTDTRERLVVDRDSKNGKCLLFVRYKDQLDETGINAAETSIINFYAYEYSSGDIIAANKTAWASSSSSAYQDATGEY